MVISRTSLDVQLISVINISVINILLINYNINREKNWRPGNYLDLKTTFPRLLKNGLELEIDSENWNLQSKSGDLITVDERTFESWKKKKRCNIK